MLNNAAVVSETLPRMLRRSIAMGALAFGLLALSGCAATALEGLDLSSAAAETVPGECSALIKIKYPFLSCVNGQIGQSAANETWESARHMPVQGRWIEGDGYWGETLNPVDAVE